MSGIERIAAERARQVSAEGWTPEHDDRHLESELAFAAICYAAPTRIKAELVIRKPSNCGCREANCPHESMFGEIQWSDPWPWDKVWDKRKKHDEIRRLEIAGALIAAEIDRLLRLRGESGA